MKRNKISWFLTLALAGFLISGTALAQETDVAFHWAPSPVFSLDGDALSPVVDYQVWVLRDEGDLELVATVKDTTYVLSVEPGVAHRLCVRGVDEIGRLSPMSDISDPVYIETETDRNGGGLPPVAYD